MKNLKKVLALVLVVATLMGLATMASATTSEDYSDAASITHVEAVDVMSSLGVFDGISGAFSGDSILTREQAAKIITYMILGKEDADALVASVAPYTDVSRDRWSAGSIAYCKNEGILAGVGNGRFEPDGKLTGVAFAKMCLVALGYDPDVEKLTGHDWAVNTSKLAIAGAGISANLSQISLANEMSREDACQMAFNTLKADLVDYTDRGSTIVIPNGDGKDIVISDSPSKAKPVDGQTARVDEKNNINNIMSGDSVLQFGERYFPLLKRTATIDTFGRPSTYWKYKSDEIGNYIDSAKLVQTWTAKAPKGEMYSAIGGAIVDDLEIGEEIKYDTNSKKYDVADRFDYQLAAYVDGKSVYAVTKDTTPGHYFAKNSSAAAGRTMDYQAGNPDTDKWNIGMSGNGVLTELYLDDDDNVTIVMINTYLVQATADYNTVTDRVNIEAKPIDTYKNDNRPKPVPNFLPTYISNDDFDVTGVKNGDYLLVTAKVDWSNPSIGTTSIESVTPATLQTASVTEYTEQEDVTMGGTKYEYNRILGLDEKGEEFAINSDATLVLDTYGYIMFVDEALTSSNFVYIDNFGSTSGLGSHPVADAYFADGTNVEVSVARVDDNKDKREIANKYTSKEADNPDDDVYGLNLEDGKNHLYTHWYTYTGSSNSEYTLTTPNQKRYESPYVALTTDVNLDEVMLIKSGTVRFMRDAEGFVDAYKLWKDAEGDDKARPYRIVADKDGNIEFDTYAKNNSVVRDVLGDENTIFVIKDTDSEVTSYTGVSNVPDVKLLKNHDGRAKVSWICKKDSKYASYVFVDVSGVGNVIVDGGTSIANYMFTLKSTGNRTYVDGLDYYKYKVMIDGKEEERWISSTLLKGDADLDRGVLFYDIKEDKDGRIRDGKQVGTKSNLTQFRADMQIALKDDIGQSGNSLEISALDRRAEYDIGNDASTHKGLLIANSHSNINVVVKGGAHSDLLYDDGADYEVHTGVSANFVKSFLGEYYLDGKVFVVVDDDDRDLVDTLWIYVEKANKKPAQS